MQFQIFSGKQAWSSKRPELFFWFWIPYYIMLPKLHNNQAIICFFTSFNHAEKVKPCPVRNMCVQASMDFKYLNDRYQRGKAAIQEHMKEKMIFSRVSSLVLAHAEVVAAQGKMGSEGFLIWILLICLIWCMLQLQKLLSSWWANIGWRSCWVTLPCGQTAPWRKYAHLVLGSIFFAIGFHVVNQPLEHQQT